MVPIKTTIENTTKRKTTILCLLAIKAFFKAAASLMYLMSFRILKILINLTVLILLIDEILFVPIPIPIYDGIKDNKSIIP